MLKHYINIFLVTFVLLSSISGCKRDPREGYHAKSLKLDGRYTQEIVFSAIGATIPLEKKNVFIRIDGPVENVEEHQSELFQELGISPSKVVYTNPAAHGRQVQLSFADGKSCCFIWVHKHPDDRIIEIRLEHEKYHALCRVSHQGVSLLSERIRQHGFNIGLQDYDEELSATIVEVLSLHLLGIPFDLVSGSELVEQARDILLAKNTEHEDSNRPADASRLSPSVRPLNR